MSTAQASRKPIKPYVDPLALPGDKTVCVHIHIAYNPATQKVDYVRCKNKAPSGWLCGDHTSRLLAKRPAATKFHDHVSDDQRVRQTEDRALDGIVRETVGLRFKISTIFGVRMRVRPEAIWVPEPYAEFVEA